MEQFDLVSLVLSEGDKEHNDVKDKGGKDVGRRWILARAVGGREAAGKDGNADRGHSSSQPCVASCVYSTVTFPSHRTAPHARTGST